MADDMDILGLTRDERKMLKRLLAFKVRGFRGIDARFDGETLSIIGSGRSKAAGEGSDDETISGLITSNATGGGIYNGKSRTDRTDLSTVTAATLGGSDFGATTLGTLASSEDCVVFNPAECGLSAGSHFVTATTNGYTFAIYFVGRLLGVTSDGKKVIEATEFFANCTS